MLSNLDATCQRVRAWRFSLELEEYREPFHGFGHKPTRLVKVSQMPTLKSDGLVS
jgi:hypothetical protein